MIPAYIVKKKVSDEDLKGYVGTFLQEKDYDLLLDHSADVFDEEGKLLVRFRKDALTRQSVEDAYDAIKGFVKNTTSDRGTASGSQRGLKTGQKKKVQSNILGYFDSWSVSQYRQFKSLGMKPPSPCRITKFTANYPEKWARVVPLVQEVDALYKSLVPDSWSSQYTAACKTPFRIGDTSFSTITTNLNFTTAAHYDAGDWDEGFGNMVVMERGAPYMGSYTVLPRYGIAIDCRERDYLAFDVHELHGNTPMQPFDVTSQRISLVFYLRKEIVRKGEGHALYDPKELKASFLTGRTPELLSEA